MVCGLVLLAQAAPKSTTTIDADAEWLALKASNQLTAPGDWYNKFTAEVSAIRAAYPAVANIHVFPRWIPGELLVTATPRQLSCVRRQKDLAAATIKKISDYGVTALYAVDYPVHYNMPLLATLVSGRCGGSATADYVAGDGNDISYDAASNIYSFAEKSGDCTGGCLSAHYWMFTVNSSGAQLTGETVIP